MARPLDPKFMMEIEDEMLMLVRTLFRRAFGNRFYRVVIMGFRNHRTGMVIESAVLVGKLLSFIHRTK